MEVTAGCTEVMQLITQPSSHFGIKTNDPTIPYNIKKKVEKKLLNINCHILSNEIRWCFVHNKRTTGYVLDIGQHQNINIYYFNYNYSLRTICCTVWNLMTIHIVLIIQIWEWTLEGQTGILCMVIHSSILKWKISN